MKAIAGNLPDDTVIWRYMDFTKFMAMLVTQSLWFAKVGLFRDDPYEGFGKAIPRDLPLDEFGPRWLLRDGFEGPRTVSFERMYAEASKLAVDELTETPEHIYVNSWSLADESMAMWQGYGAFAAGIAIRSTVGRYTRAARLNVHEGQLASGSVSYHKNIESSPNVLADMSAGRVPLIGPGLWQLMFMRVLNKRNCFEYEREWRAMLYQELRSDPGVNVTFDLDDLIGAVFIGPKADSLFFDVVSAVMEKFEIKHPLQKSTLLVKPV